MQDDCMQIRSQMPAVASRQADTETRNAVAAHLTYCRECARYYKQAVEAMPNALTLEELLSGDIPLQTKASAEDALKQKQPHSRSLLLLPVVAVLLVLLLQGMVTGHGRFSASAAIHAALSTATEATPLASFALEEEQLFLFSSGDADTTSLLLCTANYRFPLWYADQQVGGTWDTSGMMQAIGWQSATSAGEEGAMDTGFSLLFWQSLDPAVAYVEWQLADGTLRMDAPPVQEDGSPTPVWQLVAGRQAFVPDGSATAPIIAYDKAGQPLYALSAVASAADGISTTTVFALSWQTVAK